MKNKKRISLLAVLICVFALVFSLGLMSACGNTDDTTASGNWFYGTEAPADGLGHEGDFYLNTETLTAYAKSEDGTWTQTTLYSGKGVPANDAGEAGDLYLDLDGGVLYQKGESLWAVALKLQGEKGRDGILWFSGTTNPTSVQGSLIGDFYLNTTDFTVWQLHAEGWEKLGSIKGDKGDDASQLYNGNGAPTEENPANPKEGDLYLGVFKGIDEDGAGYRLYRYQDGEWNILMDTVVKNTVEIHSLEELIAFSDSVANGNTYAGKEVHLKEDIHFETTAGTSFRKNAPRAVTWSPIGTETNPFMGTFNGEGHTIYNFKANATAGQKVGFFGAVKSATIEHLRFVEAEVTATGSGSFGAVVVGEVLKSDTSDYTSIIDVVVEASSVSADDDSAKVGGLVGKADETVTVKDVDVSAEGSATGKDSLVGDGDAKIDGDIEVGEKVGEGFYKKNKLDESGEVDEKTTSYEIINLAGLEYFRDSVNGTLEGKEANNYSGQTVTLGNDIDLSSVDNWEPINNFGGTFDGKDFKISNLKIIKGSGNNVGLFGSTSDGSSVKNLTVKNVSIQAPSSNSVGAIIGSSNSPMTNVHLVGEINIGGKQWVGGLVGYGYCNITYCSVEQSGGRGIYIETYNGLAVGGIIGRISGSINDCTVKAHIEVTKNFAYIGALAGGQLGDAGSFTYNNNTFDATILSMATDETYKYRIGALIGNVGIAGSPTVVSGNKGKVVVTATVSQNKRGLVDNENAADVTVTDDNTVTVIWNGAARDDANKTVRIYSAEGLKWLRDEINAWKANGYTGPINSKSFANWTAYLEADIDLNNELWEPIGNQFLTENKFAGTFDGKGHTIFNLKVDSTERSTQGDKVDKGTGFINYLTGTGIVKNLTIENANVKGTDEFTGVLVGNVMAGAHISDITIKGDIQVDGKAFTGGFVGYFGNGAVASKIRVEAKSGSLVKGTYGVGGLIGTIPENATLNDLYTNIDVTGTSSSLDGVAAVVGRIQKGTQTFTHVEASGTITSTDGACVAGVFTTRGSNDGGAWNLTVDGFTFTGTIVAGNEITGFVTLDPVIASGDNTIKFTNSTATVTHGGTTTVYTADASGNVTSGN